MGDVPRKTSGWLALVLLLAGWPGGAALAQPVDSAPDAADVAGELSEAPGDNGRAAERTREAIRLIGRRDWPQAERVLEEALLARPDDPVNLYNLACVRAQLGRGDAAVEALERATEAGFSDFNLVANDPDLAPARALPRFKAFVADKDRWQRRAAERVVARLRARFGDDYAYAIDPARKLIYAADLGESAMTELKASVEAQVRGQYRDLFSSAPGAYVTVVVPSLADYRKIMRYRNVGGAYFEATRTLVAQRPGDVMRHEFTHALHAADRAPLGQVHAPWVAEGLGVLYESAEIVSADGADVMIPLADGARLPAATAAARRKSLVPLATLLAMTPGEFMKRPNVTYAESGALMLYLLDRGQLRAFYDTYKDTCDADPTGRVALEKTAGVSLAEFESAWVKWLLERPQAPFFGAAALFLGARVAPGGGGMTVVLVAPNGPAAGAGLERRDVILSVNGKPVKDYAALRPALGAYTPGKTVVLRIRRAGKESDVPVTLHNISSAPSPAQ